MKSVDDFIQRWEPRHEIGVPGTFSLELRSMLGEIFDEVERRAESPGKPLMYINTINEVREELGCERKI